VTISASRMELGLCRGERKETRVQTLSYDVFSFIALATCFKRQGALMCAAFLPA
jgi:hypothetical protein